MLRIINAAVEQNLFFSIANHTMTVVEVDASYTKQLTVSQFMVAPGQSVSVLVKASQQRGGSYYMAASPWRASNATFLRDSFLGIVEYVDDPITGHNNNNNANISKAQPILHTLPSINDENSAQKIDRSLFLVVGFNWKPCPADVNCTKPIGNVRVASSINNVTFVPPSSTSLMEAYYRRTEGVYTTDFPDTPPTPYDYTAETLPLASLQSVNGTRVSLIPYGANVQLVLQTPLNTIGNSTHPFHLHGFDFYIVGQGKGNFNAVRDEPGFNLVDPVRRNTALMPMAGWVALRFHADNPGVWLFHCHLELEGHVTFGMEMSFIVENGRGPKEILPPPPKDLPKC